MNRFEKYCKKIARKNIKTINIMAENHEIGQFNLHDVYRMAKRVHSKAVLGAVNCVSQLNTDILLEKAYRKECYKRVLVKEGVIYSFEYRGYNCILSRIPTFGTWCGYVDIPIFKEFNRDDICCHGGITFLKKITDRNMVKYTRVGFDAAHGFDYAPATQIELDKYNGIFSSLPTEQRLLFEKYRTKEYMINECKNIVDQIKGEGQE